MHPAFFTRRHAAVFGALLASFLALPVLLSFLGQAPKQSVYQGITREAGSFAFMGRQIYGEKTPVDLLFFGSSILRSAVDDRIVSRHLAKRFGRPVNIVVTGINWAGLDMQYFTLRDFLENRKAKVVILHMPLPAQTSARPHVQLYRLLRWGDYPDLFDNLALEQRSALYATMVLGAPRQFLNLVRPNIADDHEDSLAADAPVMRTGYYGKPYRELALVPPVLTADQLFYGPSTQSRFRFTGPPLNDYQMHFARRIVEVAHRHGAYPVFLNVPLNTDHGSTTIPERANWLETFPPPSALIGVPSVDLFSGSLDQAFYASYRDQHFNHNGRTLFTSALLPAFEKLYAEHALTH